MSDNREKLAKLHNVPVEDVCCQNCMRRREVGKEPYCGWYHREIERPKEDFCKFFINDF